MSAFKAARLRAGAWLRERKEKAEERKRAKELARAHDPHGHSRFWLLNVPATATICAAIVEWYWALLFCVEATGHVDWNWATAFGSATPSASDWNFAFSAHLPVLIGLMCATAPIVMISMVWLPVQFTMRGSGRWRRGTMIAVGLLANVLVIVSGTVVMNYNRQSQVRDALVVEQAADQGRLAIGARLEVAQAELARITDPSMTTNEARAARAGVAGWRTYIREATADPTVPAADRQRIARAMGSAEAADALRARIEALTVERAQATPAAATQANVQDNIGAEMNAFAQRVEVYRPPFVALICTLVGVFGAWWVVALLEHLNPRDVLRSGWASDAERIEDMREQDAVVPQPMKPAREVVTDADSGEELVKVRPHWRKLKKGKAQRVEIKPEPQPDEVGVAVDGGERIGTPWESGFGGGDAAQNAGDEKNNAGEQHADEKASNVEVTEVPHPEPPELTDEELAAIDAELEAAVESVVESPEQSVEADVPVAPIAPLNAMLPPEQEGKADEPAQDDGSNNQHDDTSERDEPEDRPERMIA